MKTRELIEALQREDPSGECEVVAGGTPIHFAQREPAYYDGALEILVHDERLRGKCYSVVGYKFSDAGFKVKLHLLELEDALLDDPELPVDLSGLSESRRLRYAQMVEEKREDMRRINREVDERNGGGR